MRLEGYEVKQGKYLAFRGPAQKRFIRSFRLGDDYALDALQHRFGQHNRSKTAEKITPKTSKKFNLLIDIQAKLNVGKGAGYQRWATLFNLKQMAQVMCFLQENGIEDFDELTARTDAAISQFNSLGDSIKAAEQRMQEIAELKKHIINYSKTRDVYVAYRKAAKGAFDKLGLKKLPRVKELNAEYSQLLEQKRVAYPAYRKARTQMQEFLVAQKVAAVLLEKEQEQETIEERRKQEQQPDPHR